MEKLVDNCGFALMLLAGLIGLVGVVHLVRSTNLYGFGYEMLPFIWIGSGLGVFLWGVFFSALAEIIRRLPAPPAELVEVKSTRGKSPGYVTQDEEESRD